MQMAVQICIVCWCFSELMISLHLLKFVVPAQVPPLQSRDTFEPLGGQVSYPLV